MISHHLTGTYNISAFKRIAPYGDPFYSGRSIMFCGLFDIPGFGGNGMQTQPGQISR
jgi:hypothetical protein